MTTRSYEYIKKFVSHNQDQVTDYSLTGLALNVTTIWSAKSSQVATKVRDIQQFVSSCTNQYRQIQISV